MVRAVWNGAVVAESDATRMVEGNHYFPPESVNLQYFVPSKTRSICPWKGIATYYTILVDGVEYPDAAWSYRKPFLLARRLKGHVAFYAGIDLVAEERVS